MNDEQGNAIEIEGVSKSFRIYHERKSTLFEHLMGIVNKKKGYEELRVLNNISLTIKKGEMIGIIGRNGEGKTTLLRLLTRIYRPDAGSIRINGSIVPFLELGSGFQPELTAVDNIVLYGILLGFSKKEIIKRIPTILEYAELERFADTKLKNFSSGMYARLAFSTAIQVDPDILLVDEILSVGDIAFQEKSFKTFMSFKQKGKTIVFVTHNIPQVTRLCDRAVFLNHGKIQSIGSPGDVVNEFYRVAEGIAAAANKSTGLEVSNLRRVEPTAIAYNSSTNKVYVLGIAADQVYIIEEQTGINSTIPVGAAPREICINVGNNIIYVANRDSNSVSVIDGYTNSIIASIGVGERPRGIAFSDNTNTIYVANRDSNSVSVIDGYTNKVISQINTLKGPQGVCVNEKTRLVYVANSPENSVSVIDGYTNKVISQINVGIEPISLAVNKITNKIYVTNRGSQNITVIDGKTNSIIDHISAGKGPFGIFLDEQSDLVYITNSGSNTVSKIDGYTNKVISQINVGNFPLGITGNCLKARVYVTNQAEDNISIIDTATEKIVATIKLAAIIKQSL